MVFTQCYALYCGPGPTFKLPVVSLAQFSPLIFGGILLVSIIIAITLRKDLGLLWAIAVPILALTALSFAALFI
jgi:hypothetical protein